jgi:hypothetical protein
MTVMVRWLRETTGGDVVWSTAAKIDNPGRNGDGGLRLLSEPAIATFGA